MFFFRQSKQNEDSELEKKRRSSFAASFYSSPNALRPKSERSFRRSSNSRNINYDEEKVKNVGKEDRPEVQEDRPEVHEARPEVKESNSKSPIRRKKHYLNEQNNLIDISEEGNQNRVHTGSSKPKERYSNNELRKTQNEHLNIACRNLDSQ